MALLKRFHLSIDKRVPSTWIERVLNSPFPEKSVEQQDIATLHTGRK